MKMMKVMTTMTRMVVLYQSVNEVIKKEKVCLESVIGVAKKMG